MRNDSQLTIALLNREGHTLAEVVVGLWPTHPNLGAWRTLTATIPASPEWFEKLVVGLKPHYPAPGYGRVVYYTEVPEHLRSR